MRQVSLWAAEDGGMRQVSLRTAGAGRMRHVSVGLLKMEE